VESETVDRNARMSAWLRYAVTGLAATMALAAFVGWILGGAAPRAVWLAAALAWGLQLPAFAAVVWVRREPRLFMVGWLGGMLLRFVALAVAAFWVTRQATLPAAPLLLSLVAFMFLLVLLEPMFLRRGMRTV